MVFADNPLLSGGSVNSTLAAVEETPAVIGLTTASDPEPGGRGRIIRRAGEPIAIRETARLRHRRAPNPGI